MTIERCVRFAGDGVAVELGLYGTPSPVMLILADGTEGVHSEVGPSSERRAAEFAEPFVVLIAEDNEDDVVLVQSALEELDLSRNFRIVRDGQAALDFLLRRGAFSESPAPVMVILDIAMPRRDGFEVLEQIKRNPGLCHIPVVMLTNSDAEGDVVRSYELGACSYVVKPGRYDDFCVVLSRLAQYWTSVAKLPALEDPA